MSTRSAMEVADSIDGLSYRMLDHWIRKGAVTIADNGSGSGSRRRITDEEAAAIADVVKANALAGEAFDVIRSGELFAERLRHHTSKARLHVVRDGEQQQA